MKYLCILFILFLAYRIYKSNNPLGWYIASICIVSNDFNLFGIYSHFFYSFILFLRFIQENGMRPMIIYKPLRNAIYIWTIGILIVCIFDYNTTFVAKSMAFVREFICSIAIFLASLYFASKYDDTEFKKSIVVCFFIITCFAFFQLITGKDISHELSMTYFNSGTNSIDEWYNSRLIQQEYGRNRICSLVGFSFDYGYFSSVLGLFLLFLYYKKQKIGYLLLSLVGGIGGAIMSGSRSAIISAAISMIIFQFLISGFNLKKMSITFLAIIFIGSCLSNLSIFTDTIDAVITGGENSTGSSADMRFVQLSASVHWFLQSPIVGNGFHFVENYQGYSSKIEDVMGSESVLFSILINSGIIGFIYWTFLFYIIFRCFFRYLEDIHSKLGISIYISFIVFIFLTGIQGSMFLTFPFIAYCIENSKKQNSYYL